MLVERSSCNIFTLLSMIYLNIRSISVVLFSLFIRKAEKYGGVFVLTDLTMTLFAFPRELYSDPFMLS